MMIRWSMLGMIFSELVAMAYFFDRMPKEDLWTMFIVIALEIVILLTLDKDGEFRWAK